MPSAKRCFVVSPIGQPGSPEREMADGVLVEIVRPALTTPEFGYDVQRADDERMPGLITEHVIRQLLTADLVIADLSTLNPNVLYELAVRHATGRPLIHMMERGGTLPFDIADYRTIWFNRAGLSGRSETIHELQEAARMAQRAEAIANPITKAINLQALRDTGTGLEHRMTLMLDMIRDEVRALRQPAPGTKGVATSPQMQNAYGVYLALSDLVQTERVAAGVQLGFGWRRNPADDYATVQLDIKGAPPLAYKLTVRDGTVYPRPSAMLAEIFAAIHDAAARNAQNARPSEPDSPRDV